MKSGIVWRRSFYRGEISVAITACVEAGYPLFTDAQLVNVFIECLEAAAKKHKCVVPIYCFMPEHQHLILQGTTACADACQAMVDYKQRTGFWLGRIAPIVRGKKISTTTLFVLMRISEFKFVT